MISAIDANSLEMRIEIQRRDRKDDKRTNMRRSWARFEWKTILYNWDCRRMSFLITKFLLSVCHAMHVRSLSFPLLFSPLSFFKTLSLMDLSLSSHSVERIGQISARRKTVRNEEKHCEKCPLWGSKVISKRMEIFGWEKLECCGRN